MGFKGGPETHILYERTRPPASKGTENPLTLRFKGNTTDTSFLFHLGRFICNKKRKRIFWGRGADFSFRLHTNLNWFPLPLALISKKSIQFRGLWPLEHPLDGVQGMRGSRYLVTAPGMEGEFGGPGKSEARLQYMHALFRALAAMADVACRGR